MSKNIVLLPDAGSLITLAYARELDILFSPGWSVQITDMVLYEVTRNHTPTSDHIAQWVKQHTVSIVTTEIFQRYSQALKADNPPPKKSNLGELAIQEVMNSFALMPTPHMGIFLFEDHKIARSSFLLPENCHKISTRAFLLFLEQNEWLESPTEVERKAIQAGRDFSQLRFQTLNQH